MSESLTITIRRQVLDVEVEGPLADGLALQQRLPEVCADVVSPALEAEFSRFDTGDAHLYVERLNVNLSGIALDRLEDELAEAIRQTVADLLRRNPPAASGAETMPASDTVVLRTAAATVEDALIVFLRSGRLPWSFRMPPGAQLEQLVLDAWRTTAPAGGIPPKSLARLADVLAAGVARSRLLRQFTPAFVTGLLRAWSPGLATSVGEVLETVADARAARSARTKVFTRGVWDAALTGAAAGQSPGPVALVRTAWRGLSSTEREDCDLVVLLVTTWPGVTESTNAPLADDMIVPERPRPTPSIAPPDEDADSILVDNAGLVVVHPFLHRLFEGLGVADGDELVDPARALCLIHYLATGDPVAPEYQLTVAKMLCDVPLEQPVESDVGLTAAETAEANAMLEAAIHHWGALRGTSTDALRGEFLMRPGTLTTDIDGGWLLRVESRTVDVLLEQLPWGVSMVKLPWMSRLLRVEWC